MRRLLAGAAALALAGAAGAAGAAGTKVQPAPLPAPYAGVYQPHGVDEIGVWRDDDESERALVASPLVIRDEALTGYVKSVLCEAVGTDRCRATRVYVLREPSFNATMSPNGTMRVFSGLLLRVRSEAELAFVLGHEFGHFERRHTVRQFRSARSNTDLLAWAQVLASMSPQGGTSFNSMQLSVYGALYRYQRDSEREADLTGLGYLNASKLRPQAASAVWQHMIAETEASATARGLKKPNFSRVAYFATHPPEAERANYLAALAAPDGDRRDDGADRYAAAMAKWTPVFLEDQVKLNDFGGSEYVIGMLAEKGWTAPLWYARGELFRTRGAPRDLTHAADFYAQAVALDPTMAVAYRGQGLALVKTGHPTEGRAALQRYLALRPDASDAAMITMTITSIGGGQ